MQIFSFLPISAIILIFGIKAKVEAIVNGEEASPHSHPYQVQITSKINPEFLCTGSIIHPQWVLTSASCAFWTGGEFYPLEVIAGSHGRGEPEASWQVREVIQDQVTSHPGFNGNPVSDNLALVRMDIALEFNDEVKSIRLPPEDDSWIFGTGKISGWGSPASEEIFSSKLMETWIVILPREECSEFYSDVIDAPDFSKNICAGHPNDDTGICNGDLGAPLEFNIGAKFLVGVAVGWKSVDSSINCKGPNRPDIYTKLASYNGWIQNVTGIQI